MRKITPKRSKSSLNDRTYQLNKRETVILCLSFVLSLLSFILSLFPQINILSFNPVTKANAGDSRSQFFLANHYYEIGDYEESIYWYKAASAGTGKMGACAKNNLAYLYLITGIVSETSDETMMEKIANLFQDAANGGIEIAGRNMYAFLLQFPPEMFHDMDYDGKVSWAKGYLEKLGKFDVELAQLSSEWIYLGTDSGNYIPKDTQTVTYEVVSSQYIPAINSVDYEPYYIYKIYEKKSDSEFVKYEYAYYS